MADLADAGDRTVIQRGPRPAAPAPAGAAGPAARSVVAAPASQWGGAGDSPSLLEAFLAAPSVGAALAVWFGDGVFTMDRSALLRALDRDIALLDGLLTEQVNAILHHPRFQRLEATWRGVQFLVAQADGVDDVKIKVLNISWPELVRDLERAVEFDQSQLFKKVYDEEFGMPGGEPYGILVGDYEIHHRRSQEHPTDDVAALKALSAVAAAAFAPFVTSIAPSVLGLDTFHELGMPLDLQAVFRQVDYARWNSLQETEDARFLGIVLPRILMRRPHADDGSRIDRFRFREDVEDPRGDNHLWGNAAFAFAAVLVRAFAQYGWFADIRGAERDVFGGGLVRGLPIDDFATDGPGVAIKYSTDVSISERQEKELADLGLIPLSKAKDTPYSVFYSNPSMQRSKRYDSAVASINARISTMLQYVFCVSRFAHYIKVLGREKVGSFASAEDCQEFLQRWLHAYCSANDDAGVEQKARYPLREGQVQVREAPGRPGVYLGTIHLRPHFQLDQVVSSFRLVTELAPTRAS
jgi:type VI secretion system protein ImpD